MSLAFAFALVAWLARLTGKTYPRTRVSDSAIFFLTVATLLVAGPLVV